MDSKKPDVYKTAPTFTLDRGLLEEYREQVWRGIKATRLTLMIEGRNLVWIDEQISKLPKKKENTPKKILGV